MDAKETFVDSLAQMHFAGGMVRIDFAGIRPAASQDGKRIYVQELKDRVIMTPEAFLQGYATMQSFLNQLIEAGVVKRAPAQPSASPSPEAKPEGKGKGKDKS